MQWGEDANRYPPELHLFDRFGRRLDEVTFHPAYHRLMALAMEHRIHSIGWAETSRSCSPEGGSASKQPGRHVAHAALLALFTQAEGRHHVPHQHDLCQRGGAAASTGYCGRLGAENRGRSLRRAAASHRGKAWADHRHGHDREAGRLRRARQQHARLSARRKRPWRRLPACGPQVVLLGADVRRLPHARLHGQGPDAASWSRASSRTGSATASKSCG